MSYINHSLTCDSFFISSSTRGDTPKVNKFVFAPGLSDVVKGQLDPGKGKPHRIAQTLSNLNARRVTSPQIPKLNYYYRHSW